MGGIPQTPPPQLDLAKFCPEAARQNLAKSSRAFLEARNYLNYRRAARFGQILPESCPAKFGQIEPRISHRYEGQPDLAKFCRAASGQNLAKSSRQNRISHRGIRRFGSPHTKSSPIWPNFARRLPGKIWPNRAAIV